MLCGAACANSPAQCICRDSPSRHTALPTATNHHNTCAGAPHARAGICQPAQSSSGKNPSNASEENSSRQTCRAFQNVPASSTASQTCRQNAAAQAAGFGGPDCQNRVAKAESIISSTAASTSCQRSARGELHTGRRSAAAAAKMLRVTAGNENLSCVLFMRGASVSARC